MQIHVINHRTHDHTQYRMAEVISLKLDHHDRPYAIVTHPFDENGYVRAEFVDDEWRVYIL